MSYRLIYLTRVVIKKEQGGVTMPKKTKKIAKSRKSIVGSGTLSDREKMMVKKS